jgi:hypothetical protein
LRFLNIPTEYQLVKIFPFKHHLEDTCMKNVILFGLICLFSLVSTQAHADGRFHAWGRSPVGVVVPIVAAAAVVTAAVIIASHPQPAPRVVYVQPYAAPVYVPAGQQVIYVTQ